ncbi:glycosyltransferase family 1 protein [Micromonospora endolithica]|uniref:Glycosyltransferase family 1 protein n=1 Tax=Micromonospora endolithica TaxID=230091 RepID=A0A3A9ZL87_9ACTN|nr:glycosyltransferase family 1 protein [Micromonospora endolithica]RKN49093.1 glycosyltransferase family 1 protein [Micromonospora endolithica]TWJ23244.1 hypothetical protein JD76_03379 [Micromonospora endolithica]
MPATDVLLIAGVVPAPQVLADVVGALRARGARVHLAGAVDADRLPADLHLDWVCALPTDTVHAAPNRRALHAGGGERLWLRLRREPALRRQLRRVDVLVALDAYASYSVRRMARRHPDLDARFGVAEAVRDEPGRPTRPVGLATYPGRAAGGLRDAVRGTARTAAGLATARPILRSRAGSRFWLGVLTAPALPDPVRAVLAREVGTGMSWAGHPERQSRALRAAAAQVTAPDVAARLRGDAAAAELAAGELPDDLATVVAGLLAVADRRHDAGDAVGAAAHVERALGLLFHRVLHVDRLTSPLADDPAGFVAPLRRSTAVAAATAPRGRRRPAAGPPAGRPVRLLILTSVDDKFLSLIRSTYDAEPGVELRFLDLAAEPEAQRLAGAVGARLRHRLGGDPGHAEQVERWLRPHLDWADTVLVEWCAAPAALVTSVDPGTTRVVVRLHSYETLTRWPHLVDFSRVDDVVFVADHIRDLAVSLVPTLARRAAGPGGAAAGDAGNVGDAGWSPPRLHVLHNAMDLRGFVRPKAARARFHLGLVGVGQVAKDPRWALAVLRLLRAHDPRYRLLLVGADVRPETSVAARRYRAALDADLAELTPSGAVLRTGPTDDVPAALTEIGVVLSSSVREGCHVGLMEGAASGAVPVVRDWPFFAGRPANARHLYPADWVVDSPQEAVRRILAVTRDERTWRAAGAEATGYALATWDWSVVRPDLDRLLST